MILFLLQSDDYNLKCNSAQIKGYCPIKNKETLRAIELAKRQRDAAALAQRDDPLAQRNGLDEYRQGIDKLMKQIQGEDPAELRRRFDAALEQRDDAARRAEEQRRRDDALAQRQRDDAARRAEEQRRRDDAARRAEEQRRRDEEARRQLPQLQDEYLRLMRDYELAIPQDQWRFVIEKAIEYTQNLQELGLTPAQLLQLARADYMIDIKRAAELEAMRRADEELAQQRGDPSLPLGRVLTLEETLIPADKLELYPTKHDFKKTAERLRFSAVLMAIIPATQLTRPYKAYRELYVTWVNQYFTPNKKDKCIKWGLEVLDNETVEIQPNKHIAATRLFMFAMEYIQKNNLEKNIKDSIEKLEGECHSTFLEILLETCLTHYGYDKIKIDETKDMAKDKFEELFWNAPCIKNLRDLKNIDELWQFLNDFSPALLQYRDKTKETTQTIAELINLYYGQQLAYFKQQAPYYKDSKFKEVLDIFFSWDTAQDFFNFEKMSQKPDQTEDAIDKGYVNGLKLNARDRGYAPPLTKEDLTGLRTNNCVYRAAGNYSQKLWKRLKYLQTKNAFPRKGIMECEVIIGGWINGLDQNKDLIKRYIENNQNFKGVWREAYKPQDALQYGGRGEGAVDMDFNIADIISYFATRSPSKQGMFIHTCIAASDLDNSCPGGILKRAILSLSGLPEFVADDAEQLGRLRQIG